MGLTLDRVRRQQVRRVVMARPIVAARRAGLGGVPQRRDQSDGLHPPSSASAALIKPSW